MKHQREINEKKKKIGPRKSDVAGDMLDKGDKEAIAPTRHARPIKIKQRRRIKDHQSTQYNRTILPFLYLLRGMVYYEESCVVWFIMPHCNIAAGFCVEHEHF